VPGGRGVGALPLGVLRRHCGFVARVQRLVLVQTAQPAGLQVVDQPLQECGADRAVVAVGV
jgi:hypothetical protein